MSEGVQTSAQKFERADSELGVEAVHLKVWNDFSYSSMVIREAARMLKKQRKEHAPLLGVARLCQRNQNER